MELGGFLGNAGQLQASLKKGQKYAAPQQRQPIQPPAQRRSRRHPAQALPAEPLRSRYAVKGCHLDLQNFCDQLRKPTDLRLEHWLLLVGLLLLLDPW